MKKQLLAAACGAAIAFGGVAGGPAWGQTREEPLLEAFRDPPQSARPRVWWHWMNGNISEEGIAKDIDWMARTGIGGLQNFDASIATPQIVDERLVYMTPEWKAAFRFAAQRADAAGLELAIAASPGWSETGGPWVKAEDGIKKLAWSQLTITGGERFRGKLPEPPDTTGRFQSLPPEDMLGLEQNERKGPQVYRDAVVLAVPVASAVSEGSPVAIGADEQRLDAAMLSDGDLEHVVDLGLSPADAPIALTLRYAEPREIRAATLFMHDTRATFGDLRFTPVLEARVAGTWRPIATFELAGVPTTVAFAPVRASDFRVVFEPYDGPKRPAQAVLTPGVVVPPFIAPDAGPFKVKVAEFKLSSDLRVDRYETKAAYSLVNDYFGLETSASPREEGAPASGVIDLTDRMQPDGTLEWDVPAGTWRILRMGWSLTGKTNHPAPPEATGLEVDKLDGEAVERYLRHYLDMYKDAAGADLMGSRGVRALLTDSTEVGTFNWTPRMIEHFKRLRGYDPTPWLPALTGMVIGTREESDRFLYDFRRTLAQLHASEHYATVARVAHEYGLKVYGEALEDQRPVIGDDMAMRRYTDIPMAALWAWNEDLGLRPTLLGDMKGASSVGHFYGKNIIAAESMTSALAPWAHAPRDLRRIVDLEFAHGINRPIIHTSVHQPRDDRKPGLSLMIFGQFFNRHESWAEMARPWIDYIARSSFLLQQGRNVADVAYFYGEEAPITALTAFGPLEDTPVRYAYDFVNSEGLMEGLRVDDQGRLVAPSGATYRALYLGGSSERLTVPALQQIATLAEAGATIVGQPPHASPSLADDPDTFAALVARLWPRGGEARIGKGRVIAGNDVEAALGRVGVIPDVDFGDPAAARDLMFVHRKLEDGDLYFIVNRSDREMTLDARFRITGKAPEILRADDASVSPASYRQDSGATVVPLSLAPNDSLFVLFREEAVSSQRSFDETRLDTLLELEGSWEVTFQEGKGAPAAAVLPRLISLTESSDPGVRYFSGEATYTKSFRLPKGVPPGEPLWLDLGEVGDLAEVSVNGIVIGTAWHAPFRLDIGEAVRPGENHLEIKVANLWVNRLIGDAQPGAEKITFTTIPTYRPDAPLRPAGLIGPVTVKSAADRP